jgi:hypothetical protein
MGFSMAVTSTTGSRVGELKSRLDVYRRVYGVLPQATRAIEETERRVARDRNQIRHLEEQAAELSEQIRIRKQEAEGRIKLLEAVLEDAARELGLLLEEHWSPTPILGFRAWEISNNQLVGIKTSWRTPSMSAICLTGGGREGIPHSDGRCGRLGCGIYAAKSIHQIIDSDQLTPGDQYVLGLVAMEGKVVEHERGYRAERATIVAVAGGIHTKQIRSSDISTIEELCTDPQFVIDNRGHPFDRRSDAIAEAVGYLTDQHTRRSAWT